MGISQLREALGDKDDGMPLKSAVHIHGIPIMTFKGHTYGNTLSRRRGKKTIIKSEE